MVDEDVGVAEHKGGERCVDLGTDSSGLSEAMNAGDKGLLSLSRENVSDYSVAALDDLTELPLHLYVFFSHLLDQFFLAYAIILSSFWIIKKMNEFVVDVPEGVNLLKNKLLRLLEYPL